MAVETLAATTIIYRRGHLWAVVNLNDTHSAELTLPAPAIFDTDDPAVSPDQPRTGQTRLSPQQALLLSSAVDHANVA